MLGESSDFYELHPHFGRFTNILRFTIDFSFNIKIRYSVRVFLHKALKIVISSIVAMFIVYIMQIRMFDMVRSLVCPLVESSSNTKGT